MPKENNNLERQIQYLIYQAPDNSATINVIAKYETIWANQTAIALLFDIDRTGIGRHMKNIFAEGELDEKVACANFALPTLHGAIPDKIQKHDTKFYNLDAIIAEHKPSHHCGTNY
jgi:hypothetical protein